MNYRFLTILGEIFIYGMFTSPIISILIVRRLNRLSLTGKIAVGSLITVVLTALFYTIGIVIMLMNGMMPA